MYLEITNDIHLGLKFGCSNAENRKIDYFIFGHRHLAMTYKMKEGAEIVFLGDWITNSSYAEWDGNSLIFRTIP